jgi:hypothetical protein
MARFFILYDARARDGDTLESSILCTAQSEVDIAVCNELFADQEAVWFEYDQHETALSNERRRADLDPE